MSRDCVRTGEKGLMVQQARRTQCSDPFPVLTGFLECFWLLLEALYKELALFLHMPRAKSRKPPREPRALTTPLETVSRISPAALHLWVPQHILPSFT